MSWSFHEVGTPEKVSEALTAYAGNLTGQSKVEFAGALPYLVGVTNQNFAAGANVLIKLSANGHGYTNDGEITKNVCNVTVENLGKVLI